MSPRTTSATAITTCGHSDRDSRDPRRDGGRNLLPFLTHHLVPLARVVMRVEPRFVRSDEVSVLVPPVARFAQPRTPAERATSDGFHRRSSDDRRARAPGPSEGRVTERVSSKSCRSNGCVALMAHADRTFPSSASKGHPLSPARSLELGESHSERRRTGQDRRSTAIPRRTTAS